MNSKELIMDTSNERKYYSNLYWHWFKYKYLPVNIFIATVSLLLGFWMVYSPSWNQIVIMYYLPDLLFVGGGICMVALVYGYFKTKLDVEKGLFGVRVDNNGLKFFDRGKQWRFSEIEFVFIDENYHPLRGYVVIKTKKTPPVKVTDDLLKDPKKFWLAIHWKDRRNYWDTRVVKDVSRFIKTLKYYGVKVYHRKKGSDTIIVEV